MKKKITSQFITIMLCLSPLISMSQFNNDGQIQAPNLDRIGLLKQISNLFQPTVNEIVVKKQALVQFNINELPSENFPGSPAYLRYEELRNSLGGKLIDHCNCGRVVYLIEFKNEDDAKKFVKTLGRQDEDEEALVVDDNDIIDLDLLNNTSGWKLSNPPIPPDSIKRSVTIYLLDTGVDTKNWDEAAKFMVDEAPIYDCVKVPLSPGYNYICPRKVNNNFNDFNGHGTFGIRAITDGFQTDSIQVIPLKVFNRKGHASFFSMVCAMYHAIDNKADIINLSAGYYDDKRSPIMDSVIIAAARKDIFIVTAAGNEGDNLDTATVKQHPAAYAELTLKRTTNTGVQKSIEIKNVISVASLNPANDLRSKFSNYGKDSISIATYGENIFGYTCKGRKIISSGTSMATYYVTKELAVQIAMSEPDIDYQEIRQGFQDRLRETRLRVCNGNIARRCLYFDKKEEKITPLNALLNRIILNAKKEEN